MIERATLAMYRKIHHDNQSRHAPACGETTFRASGALRVGNVRDFRGYTKLGKNRVPRGSNVSQCDGGQHAPDTVFWRNYSCCRGPGGACPGGEL
jgi:hypothetical protein